MSSADPRLAWCEQTLVCPRDRTALRARRADALVCADGHEYPVLDGVPVMLIDDATQTIGVSHESLRLAKRHKASDADTLYVDSIGVDDSERAGIVHLAASGRSAIDPVVAYLVAATNGMAYSHLVGSLREYPIPELRLPPGDGRTLLDLGCSWGRWCLAAARSGYRPIGIDPSLGAVMAARRVATALNLDIRYVVGDARALPFRDGAFDAVFSYSVIQHFSREDATRAVGEAGRVLRPGGRSLIQMPTVAGIRCLYHQLRRRFREPNGFGVRYWTVPALRRLFASRVGPTDITVDCFFGIGLQRSDARLMPAGRRAIIGASETLRSAAKGLPLLRYVADSVYASSVKGETS